jgi:streptogramin lyase
VQWQISTGGGAFSNVVGATSTTLTIAGTTVAMSGNKYHAVFTNLAGTATSNPATLTVNSGIPTVTTQPANQTVTAGETASFTSAGSGTPTPTIQWQVSINGGVTFTDLPWATSSTLTIPGTTAAMSGNKYRAVFTNLAGTAVSSAATLTVRAAAVGDIIEYSLPTPNSAVWQIAAGPDGNLWFTDNNEGWNTVGKVGKVTTAGAFTEYPLLSAGIGGRSIVAGPDGNLWFTEGGNKVARVTTSGVITEYSIPTPSSDPRGIARGPDGNLWFTEYWTDKVAKITTSGVITEYPLPASGLIGPFGADGIVAGPDGNLWVTEHIGNKVARVTPAGVFTEYAVPTHNSGPTGMAVGSDGNLWFVEQYEGKVAKVTTAGAFTEYPLPRLYPNISTSPTSIAAGPDGNLWVTVSIQAMYGGNKVVKLTTAGVITEYPLPTPDRGPYSIAAGPDGNMWFTEITAKSVAKLVVKPARATPTTFYFAEGYTGAGFTETLSLLMPKLSGTATIDYYLEGGAQKSVMAPMTAGKVTVVDVNATAGANHQVSARVTLPEPGVAERVLHFNTGSWYGSTDQVGVTAPSTEWDFAEGSTLAFGPGQPIFSEYLTLQNPNASAVPVALNYFTDTGLTPVKRLSLAANSRTTVEVFNGDTTSTPIGQSCLPNGAGASCGLGLGIGGVSVQVKSNSLPIIAERPFYVNGHNFGDGPIKDGHDAFGANSPAKTWNFAEGTTLAGFREFLTLQNPGSVAAHVTLSYVTNTSLQPTKTLTLPGSSRTTIEVFKGNTSNASCAVVGGVGVNCGVGPDIQGVSVQVASDVPIVAERPMYMVHDFGTGSVAGAHVVVGATGLGKLFGFAAASTLAGENDYLTIQNPGTIVANVTATYYTSTGLIVKNFAVAPNSRKTVEVFKVTEGAGPGISQLGIVISSDQPVLVEKPTYNSTAAAYGATDTLGFTPPLGILRG